MKHKYSKHGFKACLTALAILALPLHSVKAQRRQSVNVEVGGGSYLIGLNYDTRLSDRSPWGIRIGLGLPYRSGDDHFYRITPDLIQTASYSLRGVSLPIAMNYLTGKKAHHIELGLGISQGLYTLKEHYNLPTPIRPGSYEVNVPTHLGAVTIDQSKYAAYGFATIAYRYQRDRGLTFRAGISPALWQTYKHLDRSFGSFTIDVSVGYTF